MATAAALAAEVELVRLEPRLAPLVERFGPCPLGSGRRERSHFESLARSIVYQQLAGKAAATIWGRARALVEGPFNAGAVLTVGEERLRSAGLSGSKAAAVLDLADRVAMGDVRLASVARRDDEAVVAELVRVRGIGRWTAEMFLMFQLGRLDVWPTGDLGVRNGYARLFELPAAPDPGSLGDIGERYRPWRSVLAWYCWRALEA
jgi:3-methyladenine DNA glycosylase/8-oxoguanine DNA glycosylase